MDKELQEAMKTICEALVIQELRKTYENLQVASTVPMFSYDEKEEKKQLNKLLKAFKEVLNYYGA